MVSDRYNIWRFCLQAVLVFCLVEYHPVEYNGQSYPVWADVLGWIISLSSNVPIIMAAIFVVSRADGATLSQVSRIDHNMVCLYIGMWVGKFCGNVCNHFCEGICKIAVLLWKMKSAGKFPALKNEQSGGIIRPNPVPISSTSVEWPTTSGVETSFCISVSSVVGRQYFRVFRLDTMKMQANFRKSILCILPWSLCIARGIAGVKTPELKPGQQKGQQKDFIYNN